MAEGEPSVQQDPVQQNRPKAVASPLGWLEVVLISVITSLIVVFAAQYLPSIFHRAEGSSNRLVFVDTEAIINAEMTELQASLKKQGHQDIHGQGTVFAHKLMATLSWYSNHGYTVLNSRFGVTYPKACDITTQVAERLHIHLLSSTPDDAH